MGDFKSGLRGALKNIDIVVTTIKRTEFRMTRSKEFDVALAALQRLLEVDQSATILFCFLFYMYYDNNERPAYQQYFAAQIPVLSSKYGSMPDSVYEIPQAGSIWQMTIPAAL